MRLKTYQITAINANKSKPEVSGQATVMKAAADFLPEQFKVHSPKLPLACFKLAGSERNTAQFSTPSPACCSVSGGGREGDTERLRYNFLREPKHKKRGGKVHK